ncbi:MAG: FAD binding domain-containing protein [Treponema sp.]|jgi:CO/xanthine dehydrogenase FAD-binding subunit|nr:FAD binding domain-containing protein [Treponema sp.]
MADQLNLVFFPSSYSELFNAWNRYPKAVPYAGGTALIREQGRPILELPSIILSLERLEEMHRISRSERYLEIGAMAKLSQIIDLGKIVPVALRHCLENIAGPQVRNMATIGGSLCFRGGRLDSSAALMALDAQYELRSAQSSRWISATRFCAAPGLSALNTHELLTRIRIPLETWDYSAYKKFSGQGSNSKVVVFLVKTQKNVLSDIRIVCKTDTLWRNKDSESILAGKNLPLNQRITADFIKNWETFLYSLQTVDELSQKELINFIAININNLAE